MSDDKELSLMGKSWRSHAHSLGIFSHGLIQNGPKPRTDDAGMSADERASE